MIFYNGAYYLLVSRKLILLFALSQTRARPRSPFALLSLSLSLSLSLARVSIFSASIPFIICLTCIASIPFII